MSVLSLEDESETEELELELELDSVLDTPIDMRPDLSEFGLFEHEKGVCEDTYQNRATLRRAKLSWDAVYDPLGKATGLIAARSPDQRAEQSVLAYAERVVLLVDQKNLNSDYLTGLDLIVDRAACEMTPGWVIALTKRIHQDAINGTTPEPSPRRVPKVFPARCKIIKPDGTRCNRWFNGSLTDDNMCRGHLMRGIGKSSDVEIARAKIMQAAPYAVDVLEDLMQSAISEPVRLKASTELLDRAGVRGGQDIVVDMTVTEGAPAAKIILEKLANLNAAAAQRASLAISEAAASSDTSTEAPIEENEFETDVEIVDAEIVDPGPLGPFN